MKIIATPPLRQFSLKHPDGHTAINAWETAAKLAKWQTPTDVKAQFSSASFVANNRVIFNIGGNKYRLIVAIAYRIGVVYIKFIGTHTEYNVIDAATVEME
ncbi:type II toxin-antitoxin system HigB family toxin [Undibacterium sp. Ji22W]|uniref:type II toxin-antitoxin system HigB family toxin n=1 Tax=Undibacterium sp. Ji22W TaxID=3413038 RepID=UPI003BF03FD1